MRLQGSKDLKTRKQRTSKYVGLMFDNGWKCTAIGIANVQGAGAKYAYHRGYFYMLSRYTSDGKCIKTIRVDANTMCKIARGEVLAEDVANKLLNKKKVGYYFINPIK